MKRVYHLDLDKRQTRSARIALLPGDPGRSALIADAISRTFGRPWRPLASKREFTTCLARIGAAHILVTSTGIGGPSASIAVDELAQLGVTTFIRVGTTGAIQPWIKTGDCVVTTASVRLDGASTHYAPIEYPAVASQEITSALIAGAGEAGVKCHAGVTASSDTFYQGEERTDSFRRYILRRFRGSTEEWRSLHVLNYEMESATVLTLTASMGLKGGCVTGVVNRGAIGKITAEALKKGETNAITVAIRAAGLLVSVGNWLGQRSPR
ncbi:MAG: uridine phosphorylase [Deltaproteobacteria bacterium]|nr:uridine phosphorylase [Deltaproteobacteria bacterium]